MDDKSSGLTIAHPTLKKFLDLGTKAISQIYCSCDVENIDSVQVSKLLEFIGRFVDDSNLELSNLKTILDPTDIDPLVDQRTFSEGFNTWTTKIHEELLLNNPKTAEDYISEMDKMNEQVCKLEHHNRQLMDQLSFIQTQLNTYEDENKSLINENSEINHKLIKVQQLFNIKSEYGVAVNSEEMSNTLNNEIQTMASEIKQIINLNEKLKTKENENSKLKDEMESFKNEINGKQTIISNLQEQVQFQNDKIKELINVKDVLDNKIEELKNSLLHYKKNNDYLKSEMFSNKLENRENYCEIMFPKPHSESSLNYRIHKNVLWKLPVTDLNANRSLDIKLTQDNLIKNSANNDVLLNEYHSIIDQKKFDIEKLVQNIKNSLSTYKDESLCPCSGADFNLLELKLTELETDNNKKYIRIVELMDQNELLKEKLESNQSKHLQEYQTLTKENKKLKIEVDKIQSIIIELNQKTHELEYQNQTIEPLLIRCKELENILDKVEDEKYTLSKEFASLNSKTDELEKELYYMNKVHEEYDKENLWLSSLKNDSRKTVTLKEPFDADVDDFLNGNLSDKSEKLSQKEKQVKLLEKMVNYQNIELKNLSAEKQRHLDEIYELKCKCDKFSKELEHLNNILDNSRDTKETLSNEVKNLNKLNETLRVNLRQVTNDYNHLQSNYHPVEEYNFLINDIRTITIERDRLVEENREFRKKNLEIENQIVSLIDKTNQYSSNTTEFRAYLLECKQTISEFRLRLKNQKRKTLKKLEIEYTKRINNLEENYTSLQMQYYDLRDKFNNTKTNYTILIGEKQKWVSEKNEINKAKERVLRELDQSLKEKKRIEVQLHKKNEMVCEHCKKLRHEKDELRTHIKNLQFEIGLLEKEIHAPKKGNHEFAQEQFDKLRQNIEKTDELLQYEKRNSESFKEQNTKLITEINQIKSQTLKKKVIDEEKSKEIIDKFKREIEELQMEKKSLNNCNFSMQNELENAKKKNNNLENKVLQLFDQNLSLETILDAVLQELKKKCNISLKLQADLHEEELLLELFHQKSVLFQQNIDTMYNEKNVLERKLHKAINDLQKSENKYLSIRKLLVDTQSHVSGDFKNFPQVKHDDDFECVLKCCQEELSELKLKWNEAILNYNGLKNRIDDIEAIITKNKKRLNKSVLSLVSNWRDKLEKVMDVQFITNSFDDNQSGDSEELDDEILKLENEIQLTVQFLNALSTFKFIVKSEENEELLLLENSRFVKKLTLKSTVTTIQDVSSKEELLSQN